MTYKDLQTFYNVASIYTQNHKEENKFNYALKKVMKQARSLLQELSEKADDLDIEYCSVNKEGNILRNVQGALEFTKPMLRGRNAERKKLLDGEVEIESHFVQEIPELNDAERDAFAGFVLESAAK